jgi:hypothetical protein
MQPEQKPRRRLEFNAAIVILTVAPAVAFQLAVETAIEQDSTIIKSAPAIVLIADLLGVNTPDLTQAKTNMDGTKIGAQIVQAKDYIDNVGRLLAPDGKASGLFINYAVGVANSQSLDEEQRLIFSPGNDTPIMTADALVQIINTAATIVIPLNNDGTKTVTAAEILQSHYASVGSAHANFLAIAFGAAGKLDTNAFLQIAQIACRENAKLDTLPANVQALLAATPPPAASYTIFQAGQPQTIAAAVC